MKLSFRIPLTLTIIMVVTGIIAFIKISSDAEPFPTNDFVLWIVACVILIGVTIRAWTRDRKKT